MSRKELFEEVCSTDFLNFKFGGRGYQDQLYDSIAKTQRLAGVKVELVKIDNTEIVWVQHDFGFLGGSLGCAEGEKITRAFEYAMQEDLPVCVQVSGKQQAAAPFYTCCLLEDLIQHHHHSSLSSFMNQSVSQY
jgi:acetyl-CoA carboxylase beta subunit